MTTIIWIHYRRSERQTPRQHQDGSKLDLRSKGSQTLQCFRLNWVCFRGEFGGYGPPGQARGRCIPLRDVNTQIPFLKDLPGT